MTDEDKKRIAEYMNLYTHPKFDWDDLDSYFAEGLAGNVKWDANFASLCAAEMQKRGDFGDFIEYFENNHTELYYTWDSLIAALFNADIFFAAMGAWLKERK